MTQPLVLSLFPGIGLLDMAFELEGFCVVRGPDVLWGGDIRRFHPPVGVFDGVIGGPPCQSFSPLRKLYEHWGYTARHGNLIPEYERCVAEARPSWFVMENVESAPTPVIGGFQITSDLVNNRWFGADQERTRRISFGTTGHRLTFRNGLPHLVFDVALFESPRRSPAVTSSDGGRKRVNMPRHTVEQMVELQGLPDGFLNDAPFTVEGKKTVLANGVPLPMGRAIARAVKRAMGYGEAVA